MEALNKLAELSYALDTFYFLMSGALVMWMAAGFAMLEAGLVRSKNTTEILTKNIALFAIACVMYMLCGYNIMYPAEAVNSVWPGLSFLLGEDHTAEAALASKGETYYSSMSDFFFQVVFVATAMSIVSGAVAERIKLPSFMVFSVFFVGLVYTIAGSWKWGGGFLDSLGFYDFAGSTLVHSVGGWGALVGAIILGPRLGKYGKDDRINPLPGSSLPSATMGAFLLWLGWFGFNGGSELIISNAGEANAVAAIFVNTNAAAAGGVIAALITARLVLGRADLTMVLNGALAGLVAITAEPLTPSPLLATLIGAVGGIIVIFSVLGLDRLRIDDPVGAISVHGTVGIWGLLAVPLTNSDINLNAQLIGISVIFGFVFLASVSTWGVIRILTGLRMSEDDEYRGVDVSECGLEAYPEFTGNR